MMYRTYTDEFETIHFVNSYGETFCGLKITNPSNILTTTSDRLAAERGRVCITCSQAFEDVWYDGLDPIEDAA